MLLQETFTLWAPWKFETKNPLHISQVFHLGQKYLTKYNHLYYFHTMPSFKHISEQLKINLQHLEETKPGF